MGEPRDREATNHNLNHLERSYKYNNESFVKYNFIQKPRGKKNRKEAPTLFQAKLFKAVLPEPGEGTQMPTKSQAGTHIWASSSPPPARVLLGTMPRHRRRLEGWYCRMHHLDKNHGRASLASGS